jgi:5'/3'-nucleotidase SurE
MRPRVLVSNDDGVVAPGLRALAHELHLHDFCEFSVCGPMGERSAQSHCITIGKHLHAFNIEVEGAAEAFAVVSDRSQNLIKLFLFYSLHYQTTSAQSEKGLSLVISTGWNPS